MNIQSKWFDDVRSPGRPARAKRPPAYRKRRHGYAGRTPAQDELLAFIKERLARGPAPTIEQMRVRMGWQNRQSVKDCLFKMWDRLPKGFDKRALEGKAGA